MTDPLIIHIRRTVRAERAHLYLALDARRQHIKHRNETTLSVYRFYRSRWAKSRKWLNAYLSELLSAKLNLNPCTQNEG